MEKLTRGLVLERGDEGSSARVKLDISLLLPDVGLFLLSALLGSYSPFEGLTPFGGACVLAAWYSGANPYFACAGAALGAFLTGSWAYGASDLMLGAGIWLLSRRVKPKRVLRLLIAFAGISVTNVLFALIFKKNVLFHFLSSTVSVFGAVVISNGLLALRSIPGGRSQTDSELATLSALGGLIVLSLGRTNVLGQSPAVIIACVFSLFAAYRLGLTAVACAVVLGAGHSLATGGGMQFTAVLALSALAAASLRALGKWAVLVSFAGTSCLITALLGGNGAVGYIECAASCLIFALVPVRLYTKEQAREGLTSASGGSRSTLLQYRIASLSEVLRELARVIGGEDGKLLGCISLTLKRAIAMSASSKKCIFRAEHGLAKAVKEGSESSGDSAIVREFEGKLLLAISDGMGSGEEAMRESRSALYLLSDLLSVGFELDDAIDCVNGLIAKRSPGDMYATLDVMLLDLIDGAALFKKHGAPESCVLRNGELYTLVSDNLPIGILGGGSEGAQRFRLAQGDAVILTSDGILDALGDFREECIKKACREEDAQKAADALLDAALARGGKDDMTVIISFIQRIR